MSGTKGIVFLGPTKQTIRGFPDEVRQDAGHALWLLENGENPPDWGPLSGIGPGVCEIRVDDGDAYRIVYVAKFAEAIYVLHAFQKKSKKGIATPKLELDTAKKRYSQLLHLRAATVPPEKSRHERKK